MWLGIVFGRFPALVDLAAAPGFENYLALLTLLVLPFVLVRMAHRGLEALVQPPSKEGMGTWQLAWQALRMRCLRRAICIRTRFSRDTSAQLSFTTELPQLN